MTEKYINTSVAAKKDDAAFLFRKYARLGFDKENIKVFEAYDRMRGVSKNEEEALKLLAVYDTIRLLDMTDKESSDAVRAVYFYDRGRAPKRNVTGMRVLDFATVHSCDERTVYRKLKCAKDLYHHLISKAGGKNI